MSWPLVAEACVDGLVQVLSWPECALLVFGVIIGALVGILPGLGGSAALAILMPLTMGLPPSQAFAVLIGVTAVLATTGDLTSIVLGIPGEGISAATVVDGHQLALRGEAPRALGASLLSSLAGSIAGALTLAAAVPFALPLARSIGSPELFMLTLFGISFLAPLSLGSPVKGLVAGGLGVMLATIGLDPVAATPRFTFGQLSLWDGIGPIPVALGLYAIPEIVELMRQTASRRDATPTATTGLVQGVRDVRQSWRLVLSSSAVGTLVGMVPGLGASVAQWLAYGFAARRAPRASRFGAGAIEGVIAPSAANNATLGGSLVPAIALGLPGGLMSALLLSALIMKGLVPGPMMLAPESQGGHLALVFSFVWLLVLANVVAVALAFMSIGPLTRVTRLPGPKLAPILIGLVLVGAFAERQSLADLLVTAVIGMFGLLMVRFDWPRAPVVMGVVLGPLAETRLFLSMDAYGSTWLWRPGVWVIAAAVGAALVLNGRTRAGGTTAPAVRSGIETTMAAALIAILAGAWTVAGAYPARAALLPRGVALVTIALLVSFLAMTGRAAATPAVAPGDRPGAAAWIPAFIVLVWAVGFVAGVPLAVFTYYIVSTRERWRSAALSSAAMFVFMYAVLERMLAVPFPPGALLNAARFW